MKATTWESSKLESLLRNQQFLYSGERIPLPRRKKLHIPPHLKGSLAVERDLEGQRWLVASKGVFFDPIEIGLEAA